MLLADLPGVGRRLGAELRRGERVGVVGDALPRDRCGTGRWRARRACDGAQPLDVGEGLREIDVAVGDAWRRASARRGAATLRCGFRGAALGAGAFARASSTSFFKSESLAIGSAAALSVPSRIGLGVERRHAAGARPT